MLPTSKEYLTRAGLSSHTAAFVLIGLFLAGVVAIRIISTLIHHYIPSNVVDCDHSHDQESDAERGESHGHDHSESDTRGQNAAPGSTERTPLLGVADTQTFKSVPEGADGQRDRFRKEPFRYRFQRSINLLMGGVKPMCDEDGPCYGFTQACGYECTKTVTPKLLNEEDVRPGMPHHQSIAVQLNSDRPAAQDAAIPETVRHASTERRGNPAVVSEIEQRKGYFEVPASQPAQETSMSSSQTDVKDRKSVV